MTDMHVITHCRLQILREVWQTYDMTGNVEEWVGTTESEATLMGGAYDTSKDHARCSRNNDTFGPGYANKKTGFRCCK